MQLYVATTLNQYHSGTTIMENGNTKLRIVRLMDPTLCMACNFAAVATVEMEDGSSRRMMHCKRLDCDNWQTEDTDEQPKSIYDSGHPEE
ncbi:MAG: hypothetical protein JWL77_3321 [Chthonomonadaceae bacterium]|nr:hypothetical protein [Chthonomonadaceae bacterium]